jgi:hypothetical protein
MLVRRILGPALAVILLAGVAAGVYVSAGRQSATNAAREAAAAIVDVRGMIGSEKETFFADPEVEKLLAARGLRVHVDKVGSREIASRDLTGYDFGFPAGTPAAITLQRRVKATQVFPTFFTPMAIASWSSLVPVLERAGVVKTGDNGAHYIVDMGKLLAMVAQSRRWNDLPGNTAFPSGKSILVNSTDVRTSNSAAMYLALASYSLNGNNVVNTREQADQALPQLSSLFLRQGLQESSSAGPFEDYTTMGMGKAPLVMVYESQFLEYQSKRAQPNPEMVLLYPQPTIFTKHTLVPITEAGRRLGEVLATDPELQKMAVRYGYRTADTAQFTAFLAEKKLDAPAVLVDVVDPPSYEMLEYMTQAIEQKFK